jgi:hypothetical protein
LHPVRPKAANWLIDLALVALTATGCMANREGSFNVELIADAPLVLMMAATFICGVLKLKAVRTLNDAHCPPKLAEHHADEPQAAGSAPR